jgi:peptidoglycan/LPS O-acetylase OafA/YrhL
MITHFSLYANFLKLMDTNEDHFLRLLNAGKFLSILWILLANNGLVHAQGSAIYNIEDVAKNFDHFDVMAISYGGFFGYDSLFLFSGLILGFTFLEGMVANKDLNVVSFCAKKAAVILAPYIFIMFLTWGLVGHLADGPFWHTLDTMYDD